MKEKKSEQELKQLIMEQIRQYPQWSDILDVAITKANRSATYQPNWDAAFVHNGQAATPDGAFRIARELGNKYDLADS
jgi:hypothetical protein